MSITAAAAYDDYDCKSSTGTSQTCGMEEEEEEDTAMMHHHSNDDDDDHAGDWWHTATAPQDLFVKRVSLDATETFLTDDVELEYDPRTSTWRGSLLSSPPHPATVMSMMECAALVDGAVHDTDDALLQPLDDHHHHSVPLETILLDHTASVSAVGDDDLWMSLLDSPHPKDHDNDNDDNELSACDDDPHDTSKTLLDVWKERRMQLAASMQKSQQSRNVLEQHIQQRACLKQVLQEIEKSTYQVTKHLLQHEHPAALGAMAPPEVPETAAVDEDDDDEEETTTAVTLSDSEVHVAAAV